MKRGVIPKPCKGCGESFPPNSNSNKYCLNCREKIIRESWERRRNVK